jgi:hypothetical protein
MTLCCIPGCVCAVRQGRSACEAHMKRSYRGVDLEMPLREYIHGGRSRAERLERAAIRFAATQPTSDRYWAVREELLRSARLYRRQNRGGGGE